MSFNTIIALTKNKNNLEIIQQWKIKSNIFIFYLFIYLSLSITNTINLTKNTD